MLRQKEVYQHSYHGNLYWVAPASVSLTHYKHSNIILLHS